MGNRHTDDTFGRGHIHRHVGDRDVAGASGASEANRPRQFPTEYHFSLYIELSR